MTLPLPVPTTQAQGLKLAMNKPRTPELRLKRVLEDQELDLTELNLEDYWRFENEFDEDLDKYYSGGYNCPSE